MATAWTIDDVEKVAGISAKGKARFSEWIGFANSEMKKGVTEGVATVIANAAIEYTIKGQTHNLEGIEIFSKGIWNGDTYTVDDIDAMVDAFSKVGFKAPLYNRPFIKLGHNEEQEKEILKDGKPALGWIDRIYREGGKLLADFSNVPQKIYEAIKRKNYRTVSAEIFWNYNSDGKTFPRVLKAVALLGADVPAVTNLEAIEGLYSEGNHVLKFYDGMEATAMPDAKVEELEKELKKLKDDNAAKETEAATELKELKDKNEALETDKKEALAKLSEEAVKVKATEIKNFIGDLKTKGKILPAFEKEAEAVLLSASDEQCFKYSADGKTVELSQRETIERLFNAMPKFVTFGETGEEEGGETFTGDWGEGRQAAGIEVDKRVKHLMAEGKAKDYTEAKAKVLASDKELKTAYAA